MSGWPLLGEDSSFSGVQGGSPSPGYVTSPSWGSVVSEARQMSRGEVWVQEYSGWGGRRHDYLGLDPMLSWGNNLGIREWGESTSHLD